MNVKLDNALVTQKNDLLEKVRGFGESGNPQDGWTILLMLEAFLPVWVACDYGYKGAEIADRMRSIADNINPIDQPTLELFKVARRAITVGRSYRLAM